MSPAASTRLPAKTLRSVPPRPAKNGPVRRTTELWSGKEDSLSQQAEAGPAVHLVLAPGQRQAGGDGGDIDTLGGAVWECDPVCRLPGPRTTAGSARGRGRSARAASCGWCTSSVKRRNPASEARARSRSGT